MTYSPGEALSAHLNAWKNHGQGVEFDFLHPNVVYEFPFDPNPEGRRFEGKATVIDFIRRVSVGAKDWCFSKEQIWPMADDTIALAEWCGHALSSAMSKPYNQHYLATIQVQDGRIIHYREFWNPDNLREAFKL